MNRSKLPFDSDLTLNASLLVRGEGEAATITAALSTENPVRHPQGVLVLDHSAGSVDLADATERGLPLMALHRSASELPIGRVRNVRIDPDRVLRGDLQFSARAEAQALRQDVVDRVITDISIGAHPDPKSVKRQGEVFRVMRWRPREASLVSLQADDLAGINRGESTVETETKETPALETPAPTASHELAIRKAYERFIQRAGVLELQTRMISEGKAADEALAALLDHVGNAGNPEKGAASTIEAGEDKAEKFNRAMENAVTVRGLTGTEDVKLTDDEQKDFRENPLASYRLPELAREFLRMHGIGFDGKPEQDIIATAMNPEILSRAIDPGTANLDTTDFTSILENVMNKSLQRGFNEAVTTWRQFCSVGSVADFKAYSRPALSHFTSLATVAENGAVADGIMTDEHEGGALVTKARKFSVTREAMVNDDLSAFTTTAAKMGAAGNRTIDEDVWALVLAGQTMFDTNNTYDETNHSNNPASGGPPTEALVTAAKTDMGRQVDSNSILLDLRPRFMLVPIELEETAMKLANAEYSPDGAANPFEPNSVRNSFVPVATARLASALIWYMFGAAGQTIEVNFLNGQQNPSVERDTGWSTFAMHWKTWIDYDPIFLDWRAAWKNPGA